MHGKEGKKWIFHHRRSSALFVRRLVTRNVEWEKCEQRRGRKKFFLLLFFRYVTIFLQRISQAVEVIGGWRKFADSFAASVVCDFSSSSALCVCSELEAFHTTAHRMEMKRVLWKHHFQLNHIWILAWKQQQLNNLKLISPFPDGDSENQLEKLLNNPVIKLYSSNSTRSPRLPLRSRRETIEDSSVVEWNCVCVCWMVCFFDPPHSCLKKRY